MATYKAPLREIDFVLNQVLHAERLSQLPGFADATPETLSGLFEECAKLVEQQLAPLNAVCDKQGCTLKDGEVKIPDGMVEFYKTYQQGGWVGISNATQYGGQGLPFTVSKVTGEMVCAANVGFELYVGLTQDCYEAIEACGNEEQKQTYCHKLATGEWAGTMCMTEPQAGSDVGAVKTKATPQPDGSFALDGGKIFITSGEHRMADNIIHFVLARLPDSPPGVKGLSTFVVPKFLVNKDGSIGARNGVRCVSIEHKMGMHGSVTCTMQFEGAKGWLVGAPNQGIQNMFVMMNLARIMVGFQGLGQCELATQNAIRYAQDRKQGKASNGKAAGVNVSKTSMPPALAHGASEIIEHADVRRMLLHMKSITEGARVLAYETALHVDFANHHPNPAVREESKDWVELNTPLHKAFCTDQGVELGSMAVQVYGGHGYIKEHGVEQIVRDAKICCLYEGTNGIQAMDLVRRKLMLHNGRLPQRFFAAARKDLAGADAFIAGPLKTALDELEKTTRWVQESYKSTPDDAAFGCADFLRAFSLTYLGWNWLRMHAAAKRAGDAGLLASKRATAEYFVSRVLTQVPALCTGVRQPAGLLMQLDATHF